MRLGDNGTGLGAAHTGHALYRGRQVTIITQAPGPESGFESGSQSIWESGLNPVCLRVNATNPGSGSGSESPSKWGHTISLVEVCD